MKLLHGSNVAVKKPDLKWCQSKNDFGRGFYLTPSWSRAWEMGKRRKNIKQEGDITVNPFDFNLKKAKGEFPKTYLEDKNLEIFIQRVSQFGSSYVQYCFCTEKALTELTAL